VHHSAKEARSPLYFAAGSETKDCRSMPDIVPLPALRDNYIWTLRNERFAAVVDPGEARPVLDYLAREKLTLAAILATHHHPDHVGGIPELLRHGPVPVYGPRGEPIATMTNPVAEGDSVQIPELGLALAVLDIPGHTRAHVAYYGAGSLFCGDTLFACGCGRLFEGTAEQMVASLGKLAALPDATKVYCGHEYTLANIAFAQQVEPGNAVLAARLERAKAQRAEGRPTLPSTLGEERASNANKYLGGRVSDPVKVFSAIREWKNRG